MPKNSVYKNITLNDDENIARLVRQPVLTLVILLIMPVALIVLAFFFMFPLFNWGNMGMAIFFSLIVIGVFWLIRNIVIWNWRTFIITNQRVVDVDQKGLFQKITSDVPLSKIQDVFYQRKGVWQTLTRIGNVNIILDDNKTKIEIRNISQPRKIQQLIIQLKADTLKEKLNSTNLSAQELVAMIKKIKAGIGEEKFKEIIGEEEENRIEGS